MTLTLHTFKGNFRAFKILIAAGYNGVNIEWKEVDAKKAGALSPAGRLPVLETPEGKIFESNAIARYVARIRRDSGLYGSTFFESGLVDSWVDFTAQEVELPATLWLYPVIGYMPVPGAAVTEKAKADLARALAIVEKHLADKTYLVGNAITLADIALASALVYPFKITCSPEFRAPFPNVMRWFNTVSNQPQFLEVAGKVKLADEEILPSGVVPDLGGPSAKKGGDKKEKPKAEKPKAEKPKKEAAKPAKPAVEDAEALEERLAKEEKKKANEHPLKIMDAQAPSKFVMDTWKKVYSNAYSYDDAMKEFWSGENHFDSEGYSLWYCTYNYNHELTKLFMTCNLVSGFVQRTDELRRWAFGCMWITGEDKAGPDGMYITGCWLFRGQSDEYIKAANPDAEYYTWTKVPLPVSDADKKKIQELWCSETTVEGRPVLDCKVFK